MRWLSSAVAVIIVCTMIAGGLCAYISWCFRFSPDRQRIWREALRRAGFFPLVMLGVIVSQWVLNRVAAPMDRASLLVGLIAAWLVPPVITLVKHVMTGPGTVPIDVTAPPSTDTKPISSGIAITVLVVSSTVSLGVWFVLLMFKVPVAWAGSMGLMPPFVLLATLFLLTRQAERSGHGAQSRHLGFLWTIGLALLALQAATVGGVMGVVTRELVIGVTGMLLISGSLLAFLVRSGRSRR